MGFDLGEWTLGMAHWRGMFANCTHIIVTLLKAWQVTMVGIECDDATFERHFKKVHTKNSYFKKKNFFSKSEARWQIGL